jgi:hypothetical protein
MQDSWNWLQSNSVQLQTFGSLAQAVGSVAAVLVAIVLAWVAQRQARAADEQAIAAKTQARAAEAQISTSLLIADKQLSPNISITAAQSRDGILIKGKLVILNNGAGVARELTLVYRDSQPNSTVPLDASTLVVRDSIGASIDEHRANVSGFTLTYITIFSTQYALDFDWDAAGYRPIDEKLRVIRSNFEPHTELRNEG